MRIGIKTLDDAVISLGDYKKADPRLSDKNAIQKALSDGNLDFLREVSEFFCRVSGIYQRLCKHYANFYRFDWYVTPFVTGKMAPNKVLDDLNQKLFYIDNFKPKKTFGDIAFKTVKRGCYYGYLVRDNDSVQVQELPISYCRSRYSIKGKPVVEFNMKFFDDNYRDPEQRFRMLSFYPSDFKKGYLAFRDGKLPPDYPGDKAGWYVLDHEAAFKFSFNDDGYPPFIATIPHIIDLDEAQALDRKKMAQKLLKIIIQKMPLDKNGDLIFDPVEARELHNNAVKMIGKAIGIDVLTTFAEVEVADMADSTTNTIDELEKVERTLYNEAGTAQNLFNTDGNIALEKSLLADEADVYDLLLQFEDFLNDLIKPLYKYPKKLFYKVQMLPTTVYNYKDMSKLYKEQGGVGGSKLLTHIALGQSQSSVIAIAEFEKNILDIDTLFGLNQNNDKNTSSSSEKENNKNPFEEKKTVGGQEKPDDEKSEKTIQNKEAMS